MKTSPWHTGRSLAITMAISYTVCALLYRLWPEQGVAFLNALFHGLDFGRLVTPAPFNLSDFFMPMTVLLVWGFITGTVFGWVSRGLDRCCHHSAPGAAHHDKE